MYALSTTAPEAFERMFGGAVLTCFRLSGLVAFAPPFRGNNIPMRVRVVFVLALTWLTAPVAVGIAKADTKLTPFTVATETGVGLLLGLALSMLSEALLFAGALMSISFSFSLANLLDPNSQVETDVLGTVLNWLGVLVLLAAGLHRVFLSAIFHSFVALPVGAANLSDQPIRLVSHVASGVFFSGLQLAAPVLAVALLVETAIALVGRMAPGLPVQMLNVPVKSVVAYATLAGSLALWPGWIERHVTQLLELGQRVVGF